MKFLSGRLGLVLGAMLVGAAVAGAGLFFLRPHLGAAKSPAASPAAEVEHIAVELEEFVVNLADTDRARYLKVTLALEVCDEKVAKELEEKLLPRVRDAIIMTLSKQYYRTLNTPEGKDALKRQLVAAVNQAIPEGHGKVADVLFTSLVMQ